MSAVVPFKRVRASNSRQHYGRPRRAYSRRPWWQRFWLLKLAIGTIAIVALAIGGIWSNTPPPVASARPATVQRRPGIIDGRSAVIIDGDTIALGSERIRIENIDAPESVRPRCDRELIAGLKAKE